MGALFLAAKQFELAGTSLAVCLLVIGSLPQIRDKSKKLSAFFQVIGMLTLLLAFTEFDVKRALVILALLVAAATATTLIICLAVILFTIATTIWHKLFRTGGRMER